MDKVLDFKNPRDVTFKTGVLCEFLQLEKAGAFGHNSNNVEELLSGYCEHTLTKNSLVLFISRISSWTENSHPTLKPFKYAGTIDYFTELFPDIPTFLSAYLFRQDESQTRLAYEKYLDKIRRLEGFLPIETADGPKFFNYEKELNLSCDIEPNGTGIHTIISSKKPTEDLETITKEILPYITRTFNQLEPNRAINPEIIQNVLDMAYRRNLLLPSRKQS
jgi:hypothetical protein